MQQQTNLNIVTGPEQPQEEVQLTELRPVKLKRSYIKENYAVFKDIDVTNTTDSTDTIDAVDATDALKALRSLSGDCSDGDNFNLRKSNFCKNAEQLELRSSKHRRVEVCRKRAKVTKNNAQNVDFDEEENSEVAKKKVRNDSKIVKIPKRKLTSSSIKKKDNDWESNYGMDEKSIRKDTTESDEDDEDEQLYLDLEKKDCLKDEVYVYRQESLDPCSSSESEELDTINHKDSCEDYPTTDGELFNGKRKFIEETSNADNEKEKFEFKTDGITEKEIHPQNPQKKYCCVVCDARFKGSGGLRNHYKVLHGDGPAFKCDDCGKEFPLKERLKLHVRTHTGFKPYKCQECDKSFARGGQLVQHRRTHSQVRPFHCKLCSNTFTCAANLALHLKRHNGQKDHKCDLCGRAFVRRDALKKHLECLHRDVKSFLCAICNKTFKGHLPQHMRTHAHDRPHGCATCGQRFAQKSQLTVHQRTHSGQRPFRCQVCWQAFAHSTALKLHTRRHTGERPFKCPECNAGFTQLPHWKKHMKCIHGRNNPYGCKRCKSFFRIKSDLESHEKICHPEMEAENDDGDVLPADKSPGCSEIVEKTSVTAKYKLMTVEKMRLLLAVLLKKISKQERLDELGFGKRLIDDVLQDSLRYAGKEPVMRNGLSELEALTRNLEIFLEWTVPKKHWENFRKMKKSAEEILETLTDT
ncbi:hypothetical protein ALC62_05579 [Cyphomyrmex costatus]|uniref:C2H2-type domain-containing protein n=1 Tax=Cyphomyrmex costatus TaxID=456900 RepID=A0A195CRT5_9HYME|nr:hypothetical protein ALC62_05579 [Cyphomyrmex costatus]